MYILEFSSTDAVIKTVCLLCKNIEFLSFDITALADGLFDMKLNGTILKVESHNRIAIEMLQCAYLAKDKFAPMQLDIPVSL